MEYARLAFWIMASLFMIPFVCIAWIVLFWVRPDEHDPDEDDGFCWEDDITQEYERAA